MQNTHAIAAISAVAIAALVSLYFCRRKKKEVPPTEWKAVGKVSKLHLYPLKSGRRIEINSAECTIWGLKHSKDEEKTLQLRDRSFLVYGESNNEFKTARTFPKMVLIEVSVHDESHVSFDAPGMRSLYVKIPTAGANITTNIKLHQGEEIYSIDCGNEAAQWISRYIYGKPEGLRIGFHDGSLSKRRDIEKIHKKDLKIYDKLNNEAGGMYSDLAAIMLVNQSSVDDLNTRVSKDTKITVENFRPTVIVEGAAPFTEDDWDWLKIGDTVLRNVRPCTRCILTTIDPETGLRNENREPLKSLETYRKLKEIKGIDQDGHLTVMGINLCVLKQGLIKVGDEVLVG